MGLDANTVVWLGVKIENRRELQPLFKRLLQKDYDQIMDNGELIINGRKFRIFKHAEEPIGFGIELLDRGWREGPVQLFNPNIIDSFSSSVKKLTPWIRAVFDELDIKAEPKVWLATVLP